MYNNEKEKFNTILYVLYYNYTDINSSVSLNPQIYIDCTCKSEEKKHAKRTEWCVGLWESHVLNYILESL